jgi:vitamin B12 transporter
MLLRIAIFLILLISSLNAETLKNCEWDNQKGIPCVVLNKTPNTSEYSELGINKIVITKENIVNSGAVDTNDVLKLVAGLDIFQSGSKGQSTSIFTRGSESNHTLVMINGIAINDQSVTDGLHDFGQDFIQNIQQVEVYKGSSGAHFGPSAIAGAINFITGIDYTNSYSISGFSAKNNSLASNYTKITDNGWHLNLKSSTTISETGSAVANGAEYDGSENIQVNLNGEKWINNNLKFKSTFYSRKTVADYDGSATDEFGYVSDNRMHTLQTGLEHISKNSENNLIFHYHNYDREYENAGVLDEYGSESLVVKGERKIKPTTKLSFGYGSEYKYDWGAFENRGSYTASTKGHMKDFGIFGNAGYKFNESSILSIYGRSDDHNTTGRNQTYKLNFTKFLGKFKFGLTHSTGLRNPTLYELYGSDNYGIGGNVNLSPEKSETNELHVKYNILENISFNFTAYRTKIYDQIESNATYSKHENELIDINQEGLENELSFNGNGQRLSIFNIFSKSRKMNGQAQSRRPDLSYGTNYSKKISFSPVGPFNINFNYKYTGPYIDWDGSKNSRQKNTDIMDLSLTKNLLGNTFSLKLSNLLNERYEKPATYNQDGRQIKLGFKKIY